MQWRPLKTEGAAFFIGSLNREEKRNKIMQCLQDVTGKEIPFSAVDIAVKSDVGTDDAYIGKLYETFGKEPVDIVDNL